MSEGFTVNTESGQPGQSMQHQGDSRMMNPSMMDPRMMNPSMMMGYGYPPMDPRMMNHSMMMGYGYPPPMPFSPTPYMYQQRAWPDNGVPGHTNDGRSGYQANDPVEKSPSTSAKKETRPINSFSDIGTPPFSDRKQKNAQDAFQEGRRKNTNSEGSGHLNDGQAPYGAAAAAPPTHPYPAYPYPAYGMPYMPYPMMVYPPMMSPPGYVAGPPPTMSPRPGFPGQPPPVMPHPPGYPSQHYQPQPPTATHHVSPPSDVSEVSSTSKTGLLLNWDGEG